MSCQEASAAGSSYQYSHDETATINVYPSSKPTTDNDGSPHPWSLNSRVLIESTSTLQSSTPLFRHNRDGANDDSWNVADGVVANGTPFSKQVLDLLSRYPLQRLLIRVGDAAASSSGGGNNNSGGEVDKQQLLQEERARGPSGTSVLASFAQELGPGHQNHNNHEQTKVQYQNQYASLLRYLLDNTLFPPCGAPLDSLRVRKHGHSTIVQSQDNTPKSSIQTVNVESFLAADAATFCKPGIKSFMLSKGDKAGESGGWGAAANNGACHSSDNWGLFDSLFASSSGMTLSDLLLGTSLDATPWESGGGDGGMNKRNSVWVDMQVSPTCFASAGDFNGVEECSVKVTRGASYRVALPPPTLRDNEKQSHTLNLSLGDILLGHNTLEHSLSTEKEGWKAWYPCPLSDSSRIIMHLPKGYVATLEDGIDTTSTGVHSQTHTGSIDFNVLSWKDGHIDLDSPWAQLHPAIDEETNLPMPLPSMFGISRTVQRPLGISSSGTLVSVLRYDQSNSGSDQPKVVKVQSLDVLPGTLVKPRMHTLRMVLYRGGGAGGDRFVPSTNSDDFPCECLHNETLSTSTGHYDDAATNQCGSISCRADTSLSELQDHKLTLHPDGTILVERTVLLQPDSSLWMMVDFDEAYLPFQKFPADANRGVDTFPSRATFTPVSMQPKSSLPSSKALRSITLYSPSLLLLPPVPDMSMPFNVISLSCTLWAFVLGSLLNILVRRGTESVKRELTGEKEKRPLDKLKEKLSEKGKKLKEKVAWMKEKIRGKRAAGSQADASVQIEKEVESKEL